MPSRLCYLADIRRYINLEQVAVDCVFEWVEIGKCIYHSRVIFFSYDNLLLVFSFYLLKLSHFLPMGLSMNFAVSPNRYCVNLNS